MVVYLVRQKRFVNITKMKVSEHMANKEPNTQPLIKHSKLKTERTVKKVDVALKVMIKNQMLINFNTVSNEANVSKAFLYRNQNLRLRIESLRDQQVGLSTAKKVKRNMTDSSKDVLIESLRKRIEKTEKKNAILKKRLQKFLIDVYEEI